MKCILQKEVGPVEAMYIGESPLPLLKEKEVLIQVKAFSINRADILQRKGKYPSPPCSSPLMGLEVAGVISQASPASQWKVGDHVFGLLPGGGYAEYAAADEDLLFPMDPEMSFESAAAIPEVFLTAFLALKTLGDLKAGEKVLIHAASGGVGTAAIQLAKAMKATVVITASKSKHPICKELGADLCIDYKESSWAETLQKELGKNPINLIIDFLGASYFNDNIEALGIDGRLILLALMGGGDVEKVDLRKLIGKRIQIKGSTLRNRSLLFQRQLCADFTAFSKPLFHDNKLRAVIDTVLPWTEIIQAHKRMEANEHIGKIVMRIED